MSSWDEYIFAEQDNIDFLDELADLDEQDLYEALEDAVNLGLRTESPDDVEYLNGLCAASVAAIWSGAPFSSGVVAEDYSFIRSHIGSCETSLQELSAQLLDKELERAGDEAYEGLETYAEALS
ncbi:MULTISPECIES: DUF4259 domain-containing protein [Corynebacterium]|uniref:DUF4259 domain-containing protein n=1 Tax=Corynebacterium auriscanis TaxID=99807 RepID=A0A0A2DNQ9_9CORY|nr:MULTISPECIES: DUF4259 domain-containing protein [Corynebacterium]KGM18496.1 hypothetical protein MA47_07160 [Corynebacterium auriscanis]OFT89979.1 hypothetical protein HMPREF3098_03865 [Corynebacterium sp. HMSC28B08]WJY73387.1 hypothetical protein CAURIC_08920 [Corynebacterium auriscanis]